ncbi:MAG TPA: TIGR03435 family protein [Bryobacteraceae bacterium]|jgi:uncharacterized protein (TIGR03435 family)|nr:TIGR03435 family protein [Bryobacteraceae bacterium]
MIRQILIFGFLVAAWATAQDPAASVAFEAVSIKAFPEGQPVMMSGCVGGPGSDDPAQVRCEYVTLKTLLMRAYKVRNHEISAPGWVDSTHFNIRAKAPDGATAAQLPGMYRLLLIERFKLTLHHESRATTIYKLDASKGGAKLKPHEESPQPPTDDGPPPGGKLPTGNDGFPILRRSAYAGGPIILYRNGRARLQASNATVGQLAQAITNQLDQEVTDETGLTGRYDIVLDWTPGPLEPGGSSPAASPHEAGAPEISLFAAIEQQLGLRLVAGKAPRDVLVVDHAEKIPTEN